MIGIDRTVTSLCRCCTLIAQDCVRFDIDSKVRLTCTWIDTGLRNPYGVGHLLHTNFFVIVLYCKKIGC